MISITQCHTVMVSCSLCSSTFSINCELPSVLQKWHWCVYHACASKVLLPMSVLNSSQPPEMCLIQSCSEHNPMSRMPLRCRYVSSNPQYADAASYAGKFGQLQQRAMATMRTKVAQVLKQASDQVSDLYHCITIASAAMLLFSVVPLSLEGPCPGLLS